MSSFERFLSIVASLITIIQVMISIFVSVPKVEIKILDLTNQMVVPNRFAIFLLIGCISAFSYGRMVSIIYSRSNEQITAFLSLIFSIIGAWFALLSKKIFISPIFANDPPAEVISIIDRITKDGGFIFLYALLFLFALYTFKIPITDDVNENKFNPKAILFTTILPFIFFLIF